MAYPYPAPATDKADATPTPTDHPAHHNALADALVDLLAELGTGPKGDAEDLTIRLSALDAAASPSNRGGSTSWKKYTAGGGAVSTLTLGYQYTQASAGQAGWVASKPVGFFDLEFDIKITAITNIGMICGVYPAPYATAGSNVGMNIAVAYDLGNTRFTVYVGNPSTGVLASAMTVTNVGAGAGPAHVRIKRTAGAWLIEVTPSALATSTLKLTAEDVNLNGIYAPQVVVLGASCPTVIIAGQTQPTITGQVTNISLRTNLPDAYLGGAAGPVGAMPFEGFNEVSQYALDQMVLLQRRGVIAPSGSLTVPGFYPGATIYGANNYIFDLVWLFAQMRDLGQSDQARGLLNQFIANPGTGGRLANIWASTGINDPAGRPWVQGYFALSAYLLSFDGDCSWFDYAKLKGNFTYLEANRLTARGVFTIDQGQEIGVDGAIGTNPTGITNPTPLRYESLILSANVYLDYLAFVGIANQLYANTGTASYQTDAVAYAAKAAALKTAIQTNLWSESDGWFFNWDTLGSPAQFSKHRGADVVWLLFAGVPTTDQAALLRERLMDPAHFYRPGGITSLDITDAGYQASGIGNPAGWVTNWNGPIWAPIQFMAAHGLNRYGYPADAMAIAQKATAMHSLAATSTVGYGAPIEWWNPETGLPDAAAHAPFLGWHGLTEQIEWQLRKGWDPYLVNTTSTVRALPDHRAAR